MCDVKTIEAIGQYLLTPILVVLILWFFLRD